MDFPRSHRPFRAPRLAVVAAIVALVVAVTGVEAGVHGHLPAVDGWHDATPHGATAREVGPDSCSICRLAHETSSGPVAPGTVSEPLPTTVSPTKDWSALALFILAPEHSPRAPPCMASC